MLHFPWRRRTTNTHDMASLPTPFNWLQPHLEPVYFATTHFIAFLRRAAFSWRIFHFVGGLVCLFRSGGIFDFWRLVVCQSLSIPLHA